MVIVKKCFGACELFKSLRLAWSIMAVIHIVKVTRVVEIVSMFENGDVDKQVKNCVPVEVVITANSINSIVDQNQNRLVKNGRTIMEATGSKIINILLGIDFQLDHFLASEILLLEYLGLIWLHMHRKKEEQY